LGKYTKNYFSSSESSAVRILDLIHSYVCGTMSSALLTSFLYYVVFIDDFSREVLDFLHEDQRIGLQSVPRVQSSCGEPDREENHSPEIEQWG
jgi:hypothetical protein